MTHAPVAVVGAGPVGLVAALEFARHGIRSIVLERHASTTWHPKARNLNTRTMEIARGWGAEVHDGLVGVNLPRAWTGNIVYTRTLAGEELGRMATLGFSGPGPDVSPEIPLLSSQDVFEPILRRGAEATGLADLRFGHEVIDLPRGGEPDADGATLRVRERASGREYELDSDWVLAADGAASGIRERVGIPLDGERGIAHFVNVYFEAPLERWVNHRPGLLFWAASEKARGVFQPLDARGRWLCQIGYDGSEESLRRHDAERCRTWIRDASGDPTIDAEILSVESWSLNALVARELVRGRVILVGDSAQRLPPIGGFGVNTGIQGLHNVVWKLALVRAGKAGRTLLETYSIERRRVARFNADRSLENTRMVERIRRAAMGEGEPMAPAEAVAASKRYGNFVGMELGFHYDSSAVVADGTEAPKVEDDVIEYVPTARPGHRAPHLWIERGGERRSTLDFYGRGFALVTRPRGGAWRAAASSAAKRFGVEVTSEVVSPPGDATGWTDVDGVFAGRYGIEDDGAVLVRPDGHVAFRSAREAADAAERLESALRQVLAR